MARLSGTVDHLRDVDASLVDRARRFATDHVVPFAARWERNRRVPLEAFEAAGREGLALVLAPEDEAGGSSPTHAAVVRVAEELGAGCLTIALPLLAQNYVAWAIARHAAPEVREEFLPPMRAGRRFGGFCLTEPGAGSDASALATTARRTGATWTLDGEKAWVLLGTHAEFFIVFARETATDKGAGVGLFLVRRDAPGLEIGEPYALVGGHALGCCSIRLAGVQVRIEDALLPPGQGLAFAFDAIDFARMYVAAAVCGMLRAGLTESLDYCARRRAFGQSIASFQGPQWAMADIATHLVAARALVDQAAAHASDRTRFTLAAAHAKKFSTQVALPGLAQCAQLLGANGLLAANASGRHFLCSKIAQYLDGTTEIQNLVIARSLLRDARIS